MWQRETLYLEPKHFIDALCRDIAAATVRVRVEVYILDNDHTGQRILDALEQAAANGAKVSLLIDGFGSSSWSRHALMQLAERGINARVHNPPPRPIGWFYDHWLPQLQRLPASLAHLNKRTHRKAVVIDNERAWIGSQNYGDRFLEWRESNCLVHGAAVKALGQSLARAWQSAAAPTHPIPNDKTYSRAATAGLSDIRTNTTVRSRYRHRAQLLEHIRNAQHHVQLTTAYFVPTSRLIFALLKAAQNGAKVELIVPRYSDHKPMHWLGQLYYQTLLRGDIAIYEYLPTMMHAKSVIVDEWATIGSTNLNHRSFNHDLEIDVVLHRKESLQALRQQFRIDREHSARVTDQALNQRPWVTKLAARLAHTVRNWL